MVVVPALVMLAWQIYSSVNAYMIPNPIKAATDNFVAMFIWRFQTCFIVRILC